MKIEFHGAVRNVTGSKHLININGKRILLDCGLYQGPRDESYKRNRQFTFDPATLDCVVLSHAHIDHSGNLPNLVKNGFKGDIICTYATRDLAAIMLRDSAKIQAYDMEYLNKKRARDNQQPLQPIYSMEDTVTSLKYFLSMGYNRTREIAPGVHLTFYDAGHILGSAIVVLDLEDKEKNRDLRLVFSGDLGRPDRPIICDPAIIAEADVMLIESTYGDRLHEETVESENKLESIINKTVQRGGKVIVPSFAVGRTQELVYTLHKLILAGKISNRIPIFVDSPLAIDATEIFRLHPEIFDDETSRFILEGKHSDAFGFEMMRYTRTTTESKQLNSLHEPAVIISASGMAEAGRILHHLKNNIENPKNTILFVGWQAPNTLGRRIVEKTPKVKIFSEEYTLKADVQKINGFSAHADYSELLDWVAGFRKKPQHTFVIHGDEEASLAFAEKLKTRGLQNVSVPTELQQVEI